MTLVLTPHSNAPASAFNTAQATETLAQALALTAVERDRTGGHAAPERELIRTSGLLHLTTPTEFGGHGRSWREFYGSLRRLAQVDSALAHLFAFHHLQVASILLYGTPAQHRQLLSPTVQNHLFWGNALNPRDLRARATAHGDGYLVNGPKSYCSGSVGSDWLTLSAWDEVRQGLLIAVVPSDREGVSIRSDWDAFGQKQTDSGTVEFAHVIIHPEEVLVRPGATLTPRATLRSLMAQLILTNLYVGIAQGALNEGARYTREHTRPAPAAGVQNALDDPYIQHRFGELAVRVRPAEVLADLAAQHLDNALSRGEALTSEERGALAVEVAQAKVIAHRAAMDVSSQMFEAAGASSTSAKFGLDRFWRNARVHTLHDPIDYKLRDLGRYALRGDYPEPTSYS